MRCFISIDFPVEDNTGKLLGELGTISGIKKVNSLHLTLKFLGEINSEEAEKTEATMKKLEKYPKFNVKLHGIGAFPNENYIRVIWIGVSDSVVEKMARDLDSKRFAPHVTVARVKNAREKEKIVDLIKRYKNTDFGEYTVDGVFLKKSTLTPDGPIYEDLYEVKLIHE
jgi:2'-5' RNA ligase